MPSQHRQVQLQVADQHAQRSGDALLHGTSLGGAGGADGASWIWIKHLSQNGIVTTKYMRTLAVFGKSKKSSAG